MHELQSLFRPPLERSPSSSPSHSPSGSLAGSPSASPAHSPMHSPVHGVVLQQTHVHPTHAHASRDHVHGPALIHSAARSPPTADHRFGMRPPPLRICTGGLTGENRNLSCKAMVHICNLPYCRFCGQRLPGT